MTAAMYTSVPSHSASTSSSIAFSTKRSNRTLRKIASEAADGQTSLHGGHRGLELLGVVADAHRPPAEDVRGAHEERVADLLGGGERLGDVRGDRPRRTADAELVGEQAEALAVLGEVDRLVRRSEDAVAALLDRASEPQRRLPAELGDDADRLLAVAHGEHLLRRERLEVEAVGGVVVGRDGLGVAVDHDRLVAERAERLGGVDAAVVELDALADPVRARAEDDDARLVARRGRLVLFPPGRVQVVGRRLDLAGARIDAPEDGTDAELVTPAAHLRARSGRAPRRACRPPTRRASPRAMSPLIEDLSRPGRSPPGTTDAARPAGRGRPGSATASQRLSRARASRAP